MLILASDLRPRPNVLYRHRHMQSEQRLMLIYAPRPGHHPLPPGSQYCNVGTCVQCNSNSNCGSNSTCSSHTCVCGSPSAGNVVQNPGFNTGLGSWTYGSGTTWQSGYDVDGCPNSGSARVQGSVANEPYQCFQVDIYQPYYFGLDIYSTTVDDYSQCWLQYYNFAGCTGESGYQIVIGPQGGTRRRDGPTTPSLRHPISILITQPFSARLIVTPYTSTKFTSTLPTRTE